MPILLAVALAASPTLAQMRWERRVLIVAAPSPQDPSHLREGGRGGERDLTIVEIVGDQVRGVGDSAPALRRKFRLPATFTAILIGKDGGEKLRSAHPFPAAVLERTIDAMPMRRAGRR
jgi:hypothetical protein